MKVTPVNDSPNRHGCTYAALSQAARDAEGMQVMRQMDRNMAWFLKLKQAGDAAGVPLPEHEEARIAADFIR